MRGGYKMSEEMFGLESGVVLKIRALLFEDGVKTTRGR